MQPRLPLPNGARLFNAGAAANDAHSEQKHPFFKKKRAAQEETFVSKQFAKELAKANAPIRIRNIFVIQKMTRVKDKIICPKGEFDLQSIKFIKNLAILHEETESKFLERVMEQLGAFIELARKKHLTENFLNPENYTSDVEVKGDDAPPAPPLMKTGHENEITRLSFHEFYFYPCKERGPLTIASLKSLIAVFKIIARKNPDNLHLCLSSFPIIDENKAVHNVTIYVQCGRKPRLTVIEKTTPDNNDLNYPNTRNILFTGKSTLAQNDISIQFYMEHVDANLETKKALARHCLEQILQLLQLNPDYLTPKVLLARLQQLITNLKSNDFYFGLLKRSWDEIKDSISQVVTAHVLQSNTNYNEAYQELEKISHQRLNGSLSTHVNAEFSHTITCETAGNARCTIAIDICREQGFSIARWDFFKRFQEAASNRSTFIPQQVSYLYSSNSRALDSHVHLSDHIEQIDPLSGDKDSEAKKNTPRARIISLEKNTEIAAETVQDHDFLIYGGDVVVQYYPPLKLSGVSKVTNFIELNQQAELNNMYDYNAYLVKLEQLRILACRLPHLAKDYQKKSLACILEIFSSYIQEGINAGFIYGNVSDLQIQLKNFLQILESNNLPEQEESALLILRIQDLKKGTTERFILEFCLNTVCQLVDELYLENSDAPQSTRLGRSVTPRFM